MALFAGLERFLEQGIKGGSRQTVPRDLKEGPGQGFPGRGPQGGVVAAQFFFLIDRSQETKGDVALGGGLDQCVPILGALIEALFKFVDPPLKTVENFLGFFADVGQLTVGQIRHVSDINLAVVPQGEEGRPG